MPSPNRLFIILSSGALQAVLLLLCVWMWGVWLHGRLVETMCQQSVEESRQTLHQFAQIVNGQGTLPVGSEGWRQVQTHLEGVEIDDGFLCLIHRPTGRVICHPDIRERILEENGVPAPAALLPPPSNQRAWSHFDAQKVLVGEQLAANHDLQVISCRSTAAISRAVSSFIYPLLWLGACVAMVTAICSGVVMTCFSRRYEDKIENVNQELNAQVAERMAEFTRTRDAIIYGLARLAESRDTDTGEHLERIQHYSSLLAKSLADAHPEVDDDYVNKLRLASTLHDIGKVGIPDEILLKPGRLTDKERQVMQQHAVIGSRCLHEIRQRLGPDEFLDMAYNIAAGHHERWDGTGYPYGRQGDTIPLEARIVAVADVYDALRSRRVYKDSMSHEKATEIIREGSGSQFDPVIVDAFLKLSEEFQEVSQKSASEPEMCLLEQIRECLAESNDAADVRRSLSFLQVEEMPVASAATSTT